MKIQAAALLGVAVVIAGCAPPNARRWSDRTPLKPLSRLDCPQNADGGLALASAAADGMSCAYATADSQTQVELRLASVKDTPQEALDPIETELKALLPTEDALAAPRTPVKPAVENKDVDIDLPGLSIHTKGDAANIRVGGMHVRGQGDGDGEGGSVKVTGHAYPGSRLSVDANDGVAIVRTSTAGPNVRSTFMIASDQAGPSGWRAVGYEARGPRSGPLVVAVVKTKANDRENIFGMVQGLVRQTAGG